MIDLHYYCASISYFDRFDYVSTITQELLFVHAMERLISCYGSIYDSTLRTLFLEFYRILNHCLAITTHAIDIGLFTTMLWSFEEREKLMNFSEVLSGTRFHAAFLLLGRLRYDISLRWIDSFVYWLIQSTRKLKEIHNILSINRLWTTRLYEIGILDRDFCLYFGLSGVLSRSASLWMDARFTGYEFYQCFDYSIFLASNGDCLDRYLLRFNEIIECCRIIYGVLFVLLSDAHSASFTLSFMELLIEEFLGSFCVPRGVTERTERTLFLHSSLKTSIESSKGIYSIFIHYWTTNIISNDFLTLNQLNKFCRTINLGDLIGVLGSIDFVLGSVDLKRVNERRERTKGRDNKTVREEWMREERKQENEEKKRMNDQTTIIRMNEGKKVVNEWNEWTNEEQSEEWMQWTLSTPLFQWLVLLNL